MRASIVLFLILGTVPVVGAVSHCAGPGDPQVCVDQVDESSGICDEGSYEANSASVRSGATTAFVGGWSFTCEDPGYGSYGDSGLQASLADGAGRSLAVSWILLDSPGAEHRYLLVDAGGPASASAGAYQAPAGPTFLFADVVVEGQGVHTAQDAPVDLPAPINPGWGALLP